MDKYSKQKNILKYIIVIICVLAIIGGIGYFVYKKYKGNPSEDIYKDIKKIDIDKDIKIEEAESNVYILKVKSLQQENADVKGWIHIDDTIIDYPILQSTDNEYYLKHNYNKEESKYGSIYLNNKCDISNNNSNLIIYGHNMNDDKMFNTLLKYQDKNFYDTHKTIKIATDSEEHEYSVVCAFKSKIFYKDETNVFRYYNYINFESENQYNEYIDNCKKIQLYDTGISANYGEQLITLVTCEYSQENGRMVVVAKKNI